MILTDKEREKTYEDVMSQPLRSQDKEAVLLFARAIESAVLEKLKAQKPRTLGGYYMALCANQMPPDDVERDTRVSELEAVLRECREVMDIWKEWVQVNALIAKIDEVLK